MKTQQKTLTDRFQQIEALHILLALKVITQRDFWLLTGNYRICPDYPIAQNLKGGEKKE